VEVRAVGRLGRDGCSLTVECGPVVLHLRDRGPVPAVPGAVAWEACPPSVEPALLAVVSEWMSVHAAGVAWLEAS
jgi:hypothetical protein